MVNRKGPEEILIVEDSSTQREKLRFVLEQHGFRVTAAQNGWEAAALLARHKPDLVISDIVMPEMDGYELCHIVRGDRNLDDVPLILLTALSDPVDVMKALECGADSFIVKPFDEQNLIHRVQLFLVNQNLRRHEAGQSGLEIVFQGQKYSINSDRLQILNLLLSTYEAAVERNGQLLKAQAELQSLAADLEAQSEELQAQNEELRSMTEELDAERTRVKELNRDLVNHVGQLEAANAELEAFSYSVSHDLRAPLRGIVGFSRMLQEDYGNKLDEQGLQHLEMLQKASKQMQELIEALLGLSRVSRAEMRQQKVDLSDLAWGLAENLRGLEPARQVEFVIAEGLSAVGDPHLLKIMLENLLNNAWKFTAKTRLSRIEFGVQDAGGHQVFFIRDNGVGFDMQYAAKLFGAFQRLHSDREFPGTGIGLATVQRIINRHGGRIWAEAVVDQGATFYFTLKN